MGELSAMTESPVMTALETVVEELPAIQQGGFLPTLLNPELGVSPELVDRILAA